MANILFAKIGLKIPKTMFGKEGFKEGYDDDIRLLINLAYNNPDDTFYIIGNNSFDDLHPKDKTRLFPNNNVVNAYDFGKYGEPDRYKIPMEYLEENQISVDYGIVNMGPILNRNIPNLTKLKDGVGFAKTLASAKNYVAPIIHTLNCTGVRWVALCDDPRCMKGAFDLFNVPPIVLSQINSNLEYEHITSYEDHTVITSEVEVKYAMVESSVVLDEDVSFVDENWENRESNFNIALNGGINTETKTWVSKYSNKTSPERRYELVKEWALDIFPDVSVYGKWGDDILKESNFMGSVTRSELYGLMSGWKHSLCIPIKREWSTAKYLEYLKTGVSPFLHPYYDSQGNTQMPDFYRVDSPDELLDKINMDCSVHIENLNSAISLCLDDKYTSGQYLTDLIYENLGIERDIKNKNRKLWKVKKTSATSGLDAFFS